MKMVIVDNCNYSVIIFFVLRDIPDGLLLLAKLFFVLVIMPIPAYQ